MATLLPADQNMSANQAEHQQLLDAEPEHLENAFEALVAGDGKPEGLHAITKADAAHKHPWLQKLVPGIEKFAFSEHIGNFVAITRGPNPLMEFEAMPIYARLGMHLLFVGKVQQRLLKTARIRELFKEQSIKQGKAFDSTEGVLEHIQGFVEEYSLQDTLEQLVKPDLKDYKTFNEFFSREIKTSARPVDGISDPSIVVSAADCRLTVFDTVSAAKEVWIKDHSFTIATLLEDASLADQIGAEPSIAIFRLAPADYHRWHSPIDAVLGPTKHLPGQYYTVNPQAVNEDFSVFTANRRDINVLSWSSHDAAVPTVPVIMVAVGALLVGAISWTKSQGEECKKETRRDTLVRDSWSLACDAGVPVALELVMIHSVSAYGGSTCITLFPKGTIEFDEDLRNNSKAKLETKVQVEIALAGGSEIDRQIRGSCTLKPA